jgi:hypothetical protein
MKSVGNGQILTNYHHNKNNQVDYSNGARIYAHIGLAIYFGVFGAV